MNYLQTNLSKTNFWRVLALSVILFLFEFIWYSPWVAGNAWMESIRLTQEMFMAVPMAPIFAGSFALTILMVIGFFALVPSKSVKEGVLIGLFLTLVILLPGATIGGMYSLYTSEYMYFNLIGNAIYGILLGGGVALLRRK